jgi:hypothetical protein
VTGVSSAVAGSGISVSGSTGAVTFTNSGVTSLVAGTGISVSGATGAVTVSATGGGVTSAVAGNGIAVSGATGAVTFSVACPTHNTVGSYCGMSFPGNSNVTFGTNYAVGTGTTQVQLSSVYDSSGNGYTLQRQNVLSGTWKWLGPSGTDQAPFAIGCRVS